ncbi:MAG: Gldg family protein [Henriciella sp.]
MTARQYLSISGILTVAIFIGINILSFVWLSNVRFDVTERQLFTLSAGTKTTLANIGEPIELKFVYTRSLGQSYPNISAYASRVRELLRTYEGLSKGKLTITELDPLPFSEEEDLIASSGLIGINTARNQPLYFGIIGENSVDQTVIIGFLDPDEDAALEYNLTGLIQRLDQPITPTIGLLTTLPELDPLTPEVGLEFARTMAERFTVAPISPDFVRLPDQIDILFLAHPPILTPWQLWQIDQFMMRTGKALILLDPAAKTASGSGPFGLQNRQIRSDLNAITDAWGIHLGPDAIADQQNAIAIESENEYGRISIVEHPIFVNVPATQIEAASLSTTRLSRGINLAAPGHFTLNNSAPGRREIVMTSGLGPARIKADAAAINISAEQITNQYVAETGRVNFAIYLDGQINSAFPDGPPRPQFAGQTDQDRADIITSLENHPVLNVSKDNVEAYFIADADMLDDSLYLTPDRSTAYADNSVFLINVLDKLSNRLDLMDLRARVPGDRPMQRIQLMRSQAEARLSRRQADAEARLQDFQDRLSELQPAMLDEDIMTPQITDLLSEDERRELAELKTAILETRTALREIERSYRRDIDQLETSLRLFTIIAAPGLMLLLAGLVYWRRRQG